MSKREDMIRWCISVTKALDEAVEKAVQTGMYASKSDFVRDAVRRLLRETGVQANSNGGENHG